MATIDDLGYKSLSDMSTDEALEHIRQIRLSRRTPAKPKKVSKSKKKSAPEPNADQAAELLKILGGI